MDYKGDGRQDRATGGSQRLGILSGNLAADSSLHVREEQKLFATKNIASILFQYAT